MKLATRWRSIASSSINSTGPFGRGASSGVLGELRGVRGLERGLGLRRAPVAGALGRRAAAAQVVDQREQVATVAADDLDVAPLLARQGRMLVLDQQL